MTNQCTSKGDATRNLCSSPELTGARQDPTDRLNSPNVFKQDSKYTGQPSVRVSPFIFKKWYYINRDGPNCRPDGLLREVKLKD